MIVSEQLNYIKTRRFHAIFMPVIIEFSRCIGIYSSAKFELLSVVILITTGEVTILAESLSGKGAENVSLSDNEIVSGVEGLENDTIESDGLEIDIQALELGITRAEWLALLIEKLGLSIDVSKFPDNYYSDISTSDSYYVTAMIATEYGLLDAEDDGRARMNDNATREFAVHTLNQYLGLKPDSENYTFNDKESCKYPDDIQVAINQGWISLINGNFEPERLVSSEEVSNMLEKAVSLQVADIINENYDSRFNFANYVKVVPQGTEVMIDGSQTISIVNLRQTINAGDTFVVYVGEIPSLYLAKSVTVNGNTTVITTGEADAERAILTIDSEGVSEVEISDIEAANELSMESVETYARAKELTQAYGLQIKKGDILFSGNISLNGVKANVIFNLTDLKLKHKVNTVKNTYHITLCGDIASSVEIDWDAYDAAKISGTYVLCSANIAGVGNANITLNYSFSGRIETYNEASFEVGFDYNNAQGYRLIKNYTKKNSTNNSTTNASLALKASFDVNIMNIIKGSVYEQIGAKARYTSKTYTDGKSPNRCQNFTAWLFVDGGVRITYGIGSLKGTLINKTFVVFDENNSPAYTSFHCEDGVQVNKCSRGSNTGRYGSWGYFSPADTQYGSYIGNGSTSQGINSNGEPYTIYTYELDSDNNATITEYNGNVSALSIPSTIDGYNVTGIGSWAFSGNSKLVSVRIPDSVTSIEFHAFSNCSNLSKVTLSKRLVKLEYDAFYNCDAITEIEIPKSLERVEGILMSAGKCGPFEECDGLKKVTFEKGTTRIANGLFNECTGLEEIVIPDTVTVIENRAFQNCINLSKVTFSKNLTTIEYSAFSGCSSLLSVLVPDSVTSIEFHAFSNCSNLSKVTLSKRLVKLEYDAFYNCDAITEIEIPKSLERVEGILMSAGKCGPFEECDGLKKVTFENGTTRIANGLFNECTGLEEIVIPDTVTVIENRAFQNCINLSKVTFSKNLTTIEYNAFSGCSSLLNISIPNKVTDIDNYVFQNCTSLKEAYISNSVTDMGTHIFYGCTSLETVHIPNIRQNIMQYMFYNCMSLKNINLPDTLTCIQNYAFYNCDSLSEVVIPKNVTEIQTYAFYDCDNLIKATIPDAVTTMGTYAFSHCDNLENVTLGTGLTVIPSYAFANDGKLNNIVIPYRVSTIKDNAFNACTSLTDVTIPRSVTSIGSGVFSYPSSMTIYGIKGTYGETYANNNGIRFVNREIHATEVKLNINSLEINKGDSNLLVLTVTPSEFTDEVNWKSTNKSVATVSDDGTVKGVGAGTADIKVTVGNVSTSCKITIRQPVTSISLSSTSKAMEAGETFRITATVYPSNANNRTISWSSSDPSIAVVSNDGIVTALRKGNTTITAQAQDGSNVSRSCNITVTSNTYQVSDVSRLQSVHPYENNCKDKWVYTCNGAAKLNITFSGDTALEQNFDYVYIYDKEGNQIGCFTGTELSGRTIMINGDTVSIKLQSDGSGTAYGFKVDSITTVCK